MENLDLTKILKDCPKGTKLWHTVYGEVEFDKVIAGIPYPIVFFTGNNEDTCVTSDGRLYCEYAGECVLFPSKDQRDWSKFQVPTPKVKVTLHPFDKVLVFNEVWMTDIFSHFDKRRSNYPYYTVTGFFNEILPYNKDTAHLVGTDEKCPIDYAIEFSKEFKEE